MRKIIVFENVTIDGFMAGPQGEIDWAVHDQEITDYTQQGEDSVGTFMFGRVTYEMMASFWPTTAGQAMNPVYAKILNDAPKIVFSKSLDKPDWQNTTVVKELTKAEILKLKEQDGKDIMIFGSGSIVEQLANLGLIDEYQLLIDPVVLGKGKPLFNNIQSRMNLKLGRTNIFTTGVVFLQYLQIA